MAFYRQKPSLFFSRGAIVQAGFDLLQLSPPTIPIPIGAPACVVLYTVPSADSWSSVVHIIIILIDSFALHVLSNLDVQPYVIRSAVFFVQGAAQPLGQNDSS